MRLFYHRYLIIVSCNSVSIGVLSMLVLRLMLPTHRDPKVREGLVPRGRIRARVMMGSKEEGKLDRRMPEELKLRYIKVISS